MKSAVTALDTAVLMKPYQHPVGHGDVSKEKKGKNRLVGDDRGHQTRRDNEATHVRMARKTGSTSSSLTRTMR